MPTSFSEGRVRVLPKPVRWCTFNFSCTDPVQIKKQVHTSVCSWSLQCWSWWCMWSLCDSPLAYNQIFIHVKNHVSMEGNMVREVRCKISATGLSCLIKVHFPLIWVIFTVIFDMAIKRESVQIPKSIVGESNATRYSVWWWAYNHHKSDNTYSITQNQVSLGHTLYFAILPHYPQSACKCLSKRNRTNGFAFAWSRNDPGCFPQHIFHMLYRKFVPFHMYIRGWIGQGWPYWHIL